MEIKFNFGNPSAFFSLIEEIEDLANEADDETKVKVTPAMRMEYEKVKKQFPKDKRDEFYKVAYKTSAEYIEMLEESLEISIENMALLSEEEYLPVDSDTFYRNFNKLLALQQQIKDIIDNWEGD